MIKSIITPEEFVESWKWSKLETAREVNVSNLKIPDTEKLFLVKAGLPSETLGGESLSFNLSEETFPLLSDISENEIPEEYSKLRKFGKASFSEVCLNEDGNGEIYIFHSPQSIQFVNSSISKLANCLIVSATIFEMFEKGEKTYEIEADRNFAKRWYQEKIEIIDPEALKNHSSLWAELINDID